MISFSIDWFDLLAVQGTLKSLLQHRSYLNSQDISKDAGGKEPAVVTLLLCSFMVFGLNHDQMVNTEIRLIIFFGAKDGEALYSQQKQDWELTVPQVMNSLLPNSDLN